MSLEEAAPSRHARSAPELPVDIELSQIGFVNYALAQSGITPVRRLVVTNQSSEPLSNVTVTVTVLDVLGRSVATPWARTFAEIPAEASVHVESVELRPDPAALLDVEEQRPGTVVVEVGDEHREARVDQQLVIFAHNQWHFAGQSLALTAELLAAFVQPNHPALAPLLREARDVLRVRTGSPSTEGYQGGAERADEIAEAICRALQARQIAYSDPPASWSGQKVRTPGQVLDTDRAGTCLDTTLLLAAALEQAGLHPLLWLLPGHILVGWWRTDDRRLPQIVSTEHATLLNQLDLGHLAVIETTALTARAEPVSIDEARRAAARTVRDVPPDGVIDVRGARRQNISPLPAMHRDAQGALVVTVQAPSSPEPTYRPPVGPGPVSPHRRTPSDVPTRVRRWKNALLDLSLRNKLINLTPGASVTRLNVPDGGLSQVEDILHRRERLALRAADDLDAVYLERGVSSASELPEAVLAEAITRRQLYSDLPHDAHASRMRGLARKARTLREESGSANLYLALGTLAWDLGGKALRSPLLLLPVSLTPGRRPGEPATLTLDEGAETTPNLCLLEKLSQELGLDLPGLAEPAVDEHGIDVAATFRAVRESLDAAEAPFAVHETLDLGVLQFGTFVLWKDLDEHWGRFVENPLVRHLVESPTEAFVDSVQEPQVDLDVLATQSPVTADASQLEAIARAEAGRTFVLEGPPGTGKSQTITNILARSLARGRRVLFVAEKRAALDVVRARLDAIGLGDLCLDLHDKESRPVAVREHLRRALDASFTPDAEGHRRAQDDVTARRRVLARYADSLHGTNGVGHSLYSAHDVRLARGDGPALPISSSFVASTSAADLETIRRALPDVAELVWRVRPRRHHPWGFVRGRVDAQIDLATSTVDAAIAELADAPPTLRTLLDQATTTRELHLIAEFARPGRSSVALLDEVSSGRWQRASADARGAIVRFGQQPHRVLQTATPAILGLPLDELRHDAVAAQDGGWLGRKRKQQDVIERLRPGLWAGAQLDPRGLVQFLDEAIALREEARSAGAGAANLPGVGLPPGWNPLVEEQRALPIARMDALWRDARRLGDVPGGPLRDALRAHLSDPAVENPQWVGPLDRLASGLSAVAEAGNNGADADAALDAWRDGAPLVAAWSAGAATRRRELLNQWTELSSLLAPLTQHGTPETATTILAGEVAADDLVDAFERGLARASFDERLAASGLDDFDASAHQHTIRRFDDASAEVRAHLRSVIPQQILTARESSRSSTALGVVRREANKKRGPSVRALMAKHGDAILQVTPCVLVSPGSLARFVEPTSAPFDLVVFDEASQIRVADAVGALGRARSAVIVGDSRQMPPTSFGGAGLEDVEPSDSENGDDADVPEDEESILSECVQARVPQSWLSWHYRSQDEALIAFSNALYYDGRLASFPAPTRHGTGVSYRRVEGSFQRSGREGLRTNRIEAQAVVDDVLRRFAADDSPSVGVVTFNIQQRDLIDEMLRATQDPRVVEALDRDDDRSLFIKNLENVQGDERDTVLFSIAFSKNDRGVLPLNFGPLNRAGGERRLNVAVTRARRQVVVFCSFDPGDLRDSTAVGIKHLRAYLELAAHGVGASGDVAPSASPNDRHRDDVAAALRDRGVAVRTDVGLSDFRLDLTLAHDDAPDEPLVAVLLDGPGWARRRTVGDRDGMPRAVLEKVLGWPEVARVWLPQWLSDRESVVEQLIVAVARAHDARIAEPEIEEPDTDLLAIEIPAAPVVDEPLFVDPEPEPLVASLPTSYGGWTPTATPDPVVAAPVATDLEEAVEDGPLEFIPWTPWLAGDRTVLDRLDEPAAARQVREVVAEVVAAEGPVELRRLTRLVGGAFGIARVRQVRQDAILELLPADVKVDRDDGFAWPSHRHRRSWLGYRVSDDPASRPLAEIPLVEIANAMLGAQARQPDVDWNSDEMLRATLAVFGAKRLTDGAWSRLDEARRLARRAGA